MFLSSSYPEFINGMNGFSINCSHIFFWNSNLIWYKGLLDDKMKTLGLQISSENKLTKIRVVRTGSIEDKIAIRVKQSKTSDFLSIWDI